jgi:multisubunit Na+/H+ antiporter MnhF subunit
MATVNVWIWAATAVLICFLPCLLVMIRAPAMDRLVALEMAGILTIIVLILLSVGFRQPSFLDLALSLAFLSFVSGLVFIKFLEQS